MCFVICDIKVPVALTMLIMFSWVDSLVEADVSEVVAASIFGAEVMSDDSDWPYVCIG
jgi:hypothetical protein